MRTGLVLGGDALVVLVGVGVMGVDPDGGVPGGDAQDVLVQVAEGFLDDFDGHVLPWHRPSGAPTGLSADRVLFGQGQNALEVAVAWSVGGRPKVDELRALWRKRQANRPSPVLLVVIYPGADGVPCAGMVGTSGDPSPVLGVSVERAERIAAAGLGERDRHAAARLLDRLLVAVADQLTPGVVNSGLFASHELRTGVPQRADWQTAGAKARPLLGLRGLALVHALGYGTAAHGSAALLLTEEGTSRALAVLLDADEVFDRPSSRFGAVTPVAHGLALAAQERLGWLVVLRGAQIRLYAARPEVGVGRKGQGETFIELDLTLLAEQDAAYLALLFAAGALAPGGAVEQILAASANFAADLGQRLRERIYGEVIPGLATALAEQMHPANEEELAEAYHRSLLVLFRMLFLAYAEDRGLLPYGRNPRYDRHAVKTLAKEFAAAPDLVFDEQASSLWDDMQAVWNAVEEGNRGWDVPAYNGGLFSRDPDTNPSGAALAGMRLNDAEFGPVLRALLVDLGEDGTRGPVDFRSLSVREFGTIYEGLLESSLSIAPVDLDLDEKGTYVPAKPGGTVVVPAGQIYLHNKSGVRKSTGSYFTKQFAVEHLLDTALEPALDAHLARVAALHDAGDDAGAAGAFFDFRVADLAMGSGHFLVAAIDRIEAKFTAYLSQRPIPAVSDELLRLDQAARTALGEQASEVQIETGALLRRQIARRCIYGLDLNLMAVELARLAIWIHTFVPGLPMSALNHGLVIGNSLTGIATLDEILDILEPQRIPGQVSFYADRVEAALATARTHLQRVAATAEATKQEVRHAARAYAAALDQAREASLLCDAALAVRLGVIPRPLDAQMALEMATTDDVQNKVRELRAVHLPVRFPEVFLRDQPGFDVLLGNPPWEKVKVEEHQWWALRFPGLRSMSQKDKNAATARYKIDRPDLLAEYQAEVAATETAKNALGVGPFPGLRAATDTDLSLAFAWRFWHLLGADGRAGVVLPRGILNGRAGAQWRTTILDGGAFAEVATLTNSRHWLFDIHPQYTIGLVTLVKGRSHSGQVGLRGPYFSLAEYQHGLQYPVRRLPAAEFASWSDGAAFPLLPHEDSLAVFLKLRAHPRLDVPGGDWQFVPLRELHTTDNKAMFDFDLARPSGDLPVLTGRSFNLWNPDFGEPYAYAKAADVIPWLQARRRRQIRRTDSAFYGMPAVWAADSATLPCLHPRIAFREISRATDSRTVICALLPPNRPLVHKAPYLLRKKGVATDEAYLLGLLSSVPLDWYARRYVELNVAYGLLSSFPIPRPARDSPLRKRVVDIAGRLAAVDQRYAHWAADVGVPVGSVTDEATKNGLIAELDAVVAHLYGLSRADVEHIFATFHRGWDYAERLAAVLGYFDQWAAGASAGAA
ncbi:MAG TPA: hypothetical protein VIS06_17090 [Mycobacteriales bacterium]